MKFLCVMMDKSTTGIEKRGTEEMGFFNRLFKAGDDPAFTLSAPVDGKAVALAEVPDPTFGEEILGKGVAIIPSGDTVCSPCDGTVDLMFDTGHAVNLVSDSGIEILIHIGLETVSLKGRHFTTLKESGDKVKKGDALIRFEREAIAEEGFNTIVPMVICNSDSYSSVTPVLGDVKVGDKILSIAK